MIYYLYLDESGDDGDYFRGSDDIKGGSSKKVIKEKEKLKIETLAMLGDC